MARLKIWGSPVSIPNPRTVNQSSNILELHASDQKIWRGSPAAADLDFADDAFAPDASEFSMVVHDLK
jgi:hypothetical protein